MPPKPKFTREEVVSAALDIVSRKGETGLTAKELGQALGSSARPIFTLFSAMKEVQDEVRKAAMERFEQYEPDNAPDMPPFKRMGMKMVLFGVNEPNLFKLLSMHENSRALSFEDVFAGLGDMAEECIQSVQRDYGLSRAEAGLLFENVWIYTFGVGALCATGACHFSAEKLGEMLSTQFRSMMLLIKSGGLGDDIR